MAQKKKSASASKKAKSTKTVAKTKRQSVNEDNTKQREIASIILLVFGVLTFLLAIIKGEAGWLAIHNFVLGFSGFCAFIFPLLLIYLAVIVSMDKFSKNLLAKSIEVSLLLLFLSSSIFLFSSYDGSGFEAYLDSFRQEYAACNPLGSGLLGTILGFPLGALLGVTGARIVAILATFTDLMIITGTTVSKLTYKAKDIHSKAKSDIEDIKQRNHPSR